MDIALIAGTVSTVVFAVSNLPMLRKALRTRDVSSYSLLSLVMINAANLVYSLYVFSLPLGPIWALHTFYVVSCAIMLVLCLGQRRSAAHQSGQAPRHGAGSLHYSGSGVDAALPALINVGTPEMAKSVEATVIVALTGRFSGQAKGYTLLRADPLVHSDFASSSAIPGMDGHHELPGRVIREFHGARFVRSVGISLD